MFRDVRESLCVTLLCASLEGIGAHVPAERLKAERVRKSLLVTMTGRQRVGLKSNAEFQLGGCGCESGLPFFPPMSCSVSLRFIS